MVDFGAILTMALPILAGPVASAVTQAVEKAPSVPYKARSIGTIVLAVFLASLALCVLVAGVMGRLSTDWQSLLQILIEAIATTLAGCGAYSLTQAKKPLL
jgi:fructose-specific phosphotransferase system IIC component